nr:WHG domain-containing protein [Acidimicrobiia bacterium]
AYYSLMFDRPVRYFEPSGESLSMAVDALHLLAQRVRRCMDAGQLAEGDETEVASSLWATVHGVVCIERFKDFTPIPDWERLYSTTVSAVIRGLSTTPS